MKFKPYSILVPLGVVLVAGLGNLFTFPHLDWYKNTLVKPEGLTPPDWAFSVAWSLIFICVALSGMLVWNKTKKPHQIMAVFALNGVLNVLWSYLFFQEQLITAAFYEMLFLEASILVLHGLTWKSSRLASLLLLPYSLWVAFATVLTYKLMTLQ